MMYIDPFDLPDDLQELDNGWSRSETIFYRKVIVEFREKCSGATITADSLGIFLDCGEFSVSDDKRYEQLIAVLDQAWSTHKALRDAEEKRKEVGSEELHSQGNGESAPFNQ